MAYKPTGYPPGRPRKGEVRPDTPKKAAARAYYERNKSDEEFLERRREAVREWYWRDPEHALALSRASKIRMSTLNTVIEQHGNFTVEEPKKLRIRLSFQ